MLESLDNQQALLLEMSSWVGLDWGGPPGASNMTHHQLCTPASLGVSAFYHNTPSSEAGPPKANQTWVSVAPKAP